MVRITSAAVKFLRKLVIGMHESPSAAADSRPLGNCPRNLKNSARWRQGTAWKTVLAMACLGSIGHATPRMQKPESLTLFAFDNESIPFSRNLALQMHHPVRYSENPVLPRGEPGKPDSYGVQFYGSIIEDQGKFRMWYVALDEDLKKWPEASATIWRVAYAESIDGIHWTKPELGLVNYRGNRDNNLIEILPAPMGIINLKVIRDDTDPDPARRYKMTAQTWWVGSEGHGGRGTLAPLVSADGYTWQLVANAEVKDGRLVSTTMFLPEHHYEAGSGLYQWNGVFYITGQSNSGHFTHGTTPYSGREVLVHRSADFDHWQPGAHIAFIREGQYRSFKYGLGEETHEGISVWNRGNVLLGIYGRWHGGEGWNERTIDLGFVISNDGIYFREPMTEWTMLHRGQDDAWDQGGLLQGQGFANVGDQTYIYYGAWDPRPGGIDPGEVYPPRGGVGLATLERDRFGSLSPRVSGAPADFTTATIDVSGGHLPEFFINADGLGPNAYLRVELLDAREQPLSISPDDHAAIVRENGFQTKIHFPSVENITDLPESIRLRVSFLGADSGYIQVSALYLKRGQ
jgi:hypothetical protein